MDYQNKFKNLKNRFAINKSGGFTLLELILVIGIAILLFNVSTSSFNTYKIHSNLSLAVGGVVEAIRLAQSSSQSGKGDSKWGVEILSNQVVVFKGNSYASRVISADEPLNFSNGIIPSGLTEIVFEKISGVTTNIGTITLTGGSEIKNLIINAKGTVTY